MPLSTWPPCMGPGVSVLIASLVFTVISPPIVLAGEAAKGFANPSTDPAIVALLKKGRPCSHTPPADFYGPGLGGVTTSMDNNWGELSIFDANCIISRQNNRCVVYGPGGASLRQNGVDQPLYYVAPQHVAFMDISQARQECFTVDITHSSAGRSVEKRIENFQKENGKAGFEAGIRFIRMHSYLSAASYLTGKYEGPEAAYLSGIMFERGLGVNANQMKAAYLMYQSAAQGYYPAQIRLSEMYRDGLGVAPDPHAADYFLKKARSNPEKRYSAEDRIVESAPALPGDR